MIRAVSQGEFSNGLLTLKATQLRWRAGRWPMELYLERPDSKELTTLPRVDCLHARGRLRHVLYSDREGHTVRVVNDTPPSIDPSVIRG